MASFMGGSASAMANQIAEGFILMSVATLKGFAPSDLQSLRHELEKALRDVRALVPPPDDAQASAARNRKITRLSSAVQVVQAKATSRH